MCSPGWLKFKSLVIPSICRDVEPRKLCISVRNLNGITTLENNLAVSEKVKYLPTTQSRYLPLKNESICSLKDLYT